MLLGSRSGLAPPVPLVVPLTPPCVVPLVVAPPGVPVVDAVPDLSSTGAVVGVDVQPAMNIATRAAMANFFMMSPLVKLSDPFTARTDPMPARAHPHRPKRGAA